MVEYKLNKHVRSSTRQSCVEEHIDEDRVAHEECSIQGKHTIQMKKKGVVLADSSNVEEILTKITATTISFRLFLLMYFLFLFVFIFILSLTSVTVQFVVVDFERFEFQYNATTTTTTTTTEMKDIMRTVLLLMKVEDEIERKNNMIEERERATRETERNKGHISTGMNEMLRVTYCKSCVVLCCVVFE